MEEKIKGLHHITAVSGPPKQNFDFYTKLLGLRFTKKTINFDDPTTYHLYYGNYEATPGSSITFFPWSGVPQGIPKSGEATIVSYAIPLGQLDFWKEHLKQQNIEILDEVKRFEDRGVRFGDVDGMHIEIVESQNIENIKANPSELINSEAGIRGFYGTTLSLTDIGRTAELLQEFGWEKSASDGSFTRFTSEPDNNLGSVIDLKQENLSGRFGRGSVHHIAFRVPDDETQLAWRTKLKELGFNPTPVQDRQYFRSVYFREPGGVLFEIATDIPGFTKDEKLENLGKDLKLPSWYEKHRNQIEESLVPLNS